MTKTANQRKNSNKRKTVIMRKKAIKNVKKRGFYIPGLTEYHFHRQDMMMKHGYKFFIIFLFIAAIMIGVIIFATSRK